MSDLFLDLGTLAEHCDLDPRLCEHLGLAASVVLHGNHGLREAHDITVRATSGEFDGELRRVQIDDRALRSYGDFQEATEKGAEAVGILAVSRVLDRRVLRRLPKATGADYLMRRADAVDADAFERIEFSGIGRGVHSGPGRVKQKIAQLDAYRGSPGLAVVTDFRNVRVVATMEYAE